MNIGAFIIARLSSTRLPQKNIMPILGKPMIEHMVERVKASKMVDKIIIATSNDPSDDLLEELTNKLGVYCFRGSLDKIMDRITKAAVQYKCETIVELLGDNPLVHSDLIDDVIRFYLEGKYDYAATVTHEYPVTEQDNKLFSIGVRVQIYSQDVAKQWENYPLYINNSDRHPSSFIFDHPDIFKIGYFEAKGRWEFMNKPELNFAVNYQENFNLIDSIFRKNYPNDANFPMEKIYKQLENEKHLLSLMGKQL